MPVRNFPSVGSAGQQQQHVSNNASSSAGGRSLPPAAGSIMNVVQLYEDSRGGGVGPGTTYVYSRPYVAADTDMHLTRGLHFPSVTSTPSNRLMDAGDDRNFQSAAFASSPDSALQRFGHHMTEYERREIFDFPTIYFVGQSASKRPGIPGAPSNDGFDDEQGSYIQVGFIEILKKYICALYKQFLCQKYQ